MSSSGAVRQRWVDHVKCLAILAVVLGHTYVIGNPIHSFVYSFHIPLFFVVSGYFVKPVKPDLAKIASRLLVPYLLICLSDLIIHIVTEGASLAVVRKIVLASIWASGGDVPILGISGIGLAWFLMALFVARVVFQLLQNFLESRKTNRAIICLIYFLMMLSGWQIGRVLFLPFALNQALVATFYLFIGYSLKNQWGKALGLGGVKGKLALLTALFTWFLCLSAGVFYSIGNLFHVGSLLAGVAMSVSSSVAIMIIARYLGEDMGGRQFRFLSLIGVNSLLVLCIHWFESIFIDWTSFVLMGDSLLGWVCVGLLHVALVVAISFLFLATRPVGLKEV